MRANTRWIGGIVVSLGERIAKLRKQRGWKQKDFAKKVDVHPAHVSRWERDHMRPSTKALSLMAEVFDISVDELLAEPESNGQPVVRDPQLLRTFQQAQQLAEEDKAIIVRMVEALVTKKKMEEVLGRA